MIDIDGGFQASDKVINYPMMPKYARDSYLQ